MAAQHDVVLVGLGDFGKTVSDTLAQMIEERRIQLGKMIDSVNLHTVNYAADSVFHSTDYMNAIVEEVKETQAFKKGERFSFIFVGDFYEEFTSQYAVDFAYLPYLLESTGVLNHDDIIGFFTFASALGVVESVSEKKLAQICKFFEHLEDVNLRDCYEAPFKMLGDKSFNPVQTISGPFNRNYLLVTPGKSDVVARETGIVFAERIFYELFYLSKSFKEKATKFFAEKALPKNADKNLSCFSMVQIPRINEIQKYYLKYLLEEKILSSFLAEPLKGIDEDYFFSKFMEIVDIPSKSDDFPMERATNLFLDRYRENFSRILIYYVTGKKRDFKDYIEDTKTRINDTVSDLYPLYTDFAAKELDFLFETLKQGFEALFRVNHISGNFKTYKAFIAKLCGKLTNWENSLSRFFSSEQVYDIESDFETVGEKISRLQKMRILSIPPLRPIRQKLIENAILSLPIENYLSALIKQNLAKAFYDYWIELQKREKSPISDCEKILKNIENIESKFLEKENYILDKIQFIENMNSSYYILPMFEKSEDYNNLLSIVKNNNFGSHKEQLIKQTVLNAMKLWVKDKDIFNITQNPTDFIDFIENEYVSEHQNLFSETENKAELFSSFSKEAVEKTIGETENINGISFQTGTSLFQNEVMLVPDKMNADCLSEEIDTKFDVSLEKLEVPKDFTLGSVVYFKDYLYMSQNDMKKKDFLENYRNVETPVPKYDNSLTEKVSEMQQAETDTASENANGGNFPEAENALWKFTRAAIMFYLLPEELARLYNKTFGDEKESLSDDEIDNLAMTIRLQEALKELSDEKLDEFARDNNIRLCENREKQEKLIVHELSQK